MNLLDLIFPRTCVLCHKKGGYFCPSCLKTIKVPFQVCPICERQSPFGQTHNYCLNRYSLDGLFYFFNYEGIIREAIHQLKYKFVTDLESEFWQVIQKQIKENSEKMIGINQFIKNEKPLVIPIPLYWYKQNKRGFNQSSLFGKRLSNQYNLKFSDKILIRRKNVQSQTKLSRKEREQNVKGIFRLSPKIHNTNLNILLVDDVWTTGSTLKEATRVLKEKGFKKVWGITVAR